MSRSEAIRRRLAALEKVTALVGQPDADHAALDATVSRILEIAHAWQAELLGRWWERPTPDLLERMTPEDLEMFHRLVEVCSTF